MTHYELFFFYVAGFRPKDLIRLHLVKSGSAYLSYRNYRKAQKKARMLIDQSKYTSIKEEKKLNTPDH